MLNNRSALENTVSVINLCKSICLKAIDDKMSEFSKEIAGLATLFIDDVFKISAEAYVGRGYESDDVIYGNINFTQLFGKDAERLKSVFLINQLKQMSPEFAEFLKENPQYEQYNQSANKKD